MYRIAPSALGLALPLCILSQSALADLTPAQVWGDWRQYMEGMGYSVQATERDQGSSLLIEDLQLGFAVPDSGGAMSMSIGTLTFEEASGGTVAIKMPAEMPLSISGIDTSGQGENFTMNLVYRQSGQEILVSGAPEQITYDYDAATFALVLNELIVGEDSFGSDNAKFVMEGSGLDTQTTMTLGEMRGYEQNGSIQAMTYDIFINNPEESAQVALAGSLNAVTIAGGGKLPLTIEQGADMATMMRQGFDVAGRFAYSQGSTQMTVTDPENGNFASQSTGAGGALGVSMSETGLVYEGQTNNLAMTVNAADLPFPIQFSMEQGGFNLAAPVTKSEEPQDFAFGLTLGNFLMSDMIWGIFDPTGQLPRDAATIEVALSGKARLDVDYLDPQAAAQMGPGGPGQVQELTISTLILDAVGARLEGSGDVSFDNSDFQTLPGMPKPVGQINLSLAGANALIDKLVAMGLLPQDQAMGARMMMGLFAVAGSEPDTLNSKIEFTEDGQILANGQRIK